MGIRGLCKYLRRRVQCGITQTTLETYAGQRMAIDISIALNAMVKLGINPVHGLMRYVMKIVQSGVIPIIVFDAQKRLAYKSHIQSIRRKRKAVATERLTAMRKRCKLALNDANLSTHIQLSAKVKTLEQQMQTVTDLMIVQCKRLLTALGVPFIEAEAEADSVCAALCHAGITAACVTNDSDLLAMGVEHVLMHLTCGGGQNTKVTRYTYSVLFNALGFTARQSFVDMCILMGCDYTGHIPQIGPVRAHTFIKQHHSIENVIAHVCRKQKKLFKLPDTDAFNYTMARRQLNAWRMTDVSGYAQLTLGTLDVNVLKAILAQDARYQPAQITRALQQWQCCLDENAKKSKVVTEAPVVAEDEETKV